MRSSRTKNVDRTNYPVLSIVAIVAIVAILAIFFNARASEGITPLPQGLAIMANAVLDVQMTGHVTADTGSISAPAPTANRFDLDSDGIVDANDARILADVIDRARFCPINKQCDINNDGRVDMQDLGALNSLILSTVQPSGTAPLPAIRSPDQSSQVGSFGAVA